MTLSWNEAYLEKCVAHSKLKPLVDGLRRENKTIATLNGSFDLLHAGHLEIIFAASQCADVLLVALNSDASIQQYKSPDRPIISLPHRMQMMAALGCVDYVTSFSETDPRSLLELVQPDVHVNGVEYGRDCIEREVVERYGGRIELVELVPGLSTSAILEKIGGLCV